MNILDLPATIQLGIKTRSTKKPVSALQLYKNCIQNIMIKTGIFQETVTKNSSKCLKPTVFLSLQRVACLCHVGMKVYGNIYWRTIKSYFSKHPANFP